MVWRAILDTKKYDRILYFILDFGRVECYTISSENELYLRVKTMFIMHYSNIGREHRTGTIELPYCERFEAMIEAKKILQDIVGAAMFELIHDYHTHYVAMVGTTPVGCVIIEEKK